jgi:glyoxylase-like metal-dependent hydrolase (beta-lactamase superfamily II)
MIDTSMLPTYALQWREEIAKWGEVRYIINTEHHTDHTAGNYFFPGTIIAHQGVRDMFTAPIDRVSSHERRIEAVAAGMDMRQYILARWRDMDPEGLARFPDFQPRPPSVTFSERLNLYLGEHSFHLIHLPGHTKYQTAVYIPEERVVFTGDNFTNGWQASMVHSYPLDWIESLKKIEEMDVDVVVPGHGEIGDKSDVRRFREFIEKVVNTVTTAIEKGVTLDEAIETLSFEELLPARHPGPIQHRMNLERLYEMLAT